MKKLTRFLWPVILLGCLLLGACSFEIKPAGPSAPQNENEITLDSIPEYRGDPYIVLEDNQPSFQKEDRTTASFESYSELDELGRCGVAFANVGIDLMPTKERGSIGKVKPSGWQTVKYDDVDGKYLYNRCHLIGYQLTAENANEKNLITGTRYLNIEGMLPFENMIADYIKETESHVLYRVTPIFEGQNLVASGVQLEGYSVEDEGEGICFNIYAYNVQPGIVIDYLSGTSERANTQREDNSTEQEQLEIRGNSNSRIYHCPGQIAYEEMEKSKYLVIFSSEQEAKEAGYRKAKR